MSPIPPTMAFECSLTTKHGAHQWDLPSRTRLDVPCPGVPPRHVPAPHRCDGRLNACWPHPKWHVVASTTYPGQWEIYTPMGLRPVARRSVWEAAVEVALARDLYPLAAGGGGHG